VFCEDAGGRLEDGAEEEEVGTEFDVTTVEFEVG